jgi:hypothetical protein
MGFSKVPCNGNGLLADRQCLLAAVKVGQVLAEVVQARRQIRQERLRPGFDKAPIDGDGLLAGCQRLLATTKVGQINTEVVQAPRQIG